jgi:glycerol-3-phosphate dehydrogenase
MAAQKSSRIVFAIPRHEMIIVGTTDTDFQGPPETVSVTKADVDYLLQITNEYFPGAQLTEKDIISSYVGVRPLVKDESGSEGKTSREHTILDAQPGFTFVAGGKYTTYRLMSEQIVDRVLKNFSIERRAQLNRCQTSQPLNRWTTAEAYQQAIENAETLTDKLLATRYGAEATEIINKSSYQSVWQHEAWQAIRHTMCFNLIDFYVRRVPLFLSYPDHGLSLLSEIVLVFKNELHWNASQASEQIQKLKNYIENELSWRKDFN